MFRNSIDGGYYCLTEKNEIMIFFEVWYNVSFDASITNHNMMQIIDNLIAAYDTGNASLLV